MRIRTCHAGPCSKVPLHSISLGRSDHPKPFSRNASRGWPPTRPSRVTDPPPLAVRLPRALVRISTNLCTRSRQLVRANPVVSHETGGHRLRLPASPEEVDSLSAPALEGGGIRRRSDKRAERDELRREGGGAR